MRKLLFATVALFALGTVAHAETLPGVFIGAWCTDNQINSEGETILNECEKGTRPYLTVTKNIVVYTSVGEGGMETCRIDSVKITPNAPQCPHMENSRN